MYINFWYPICTSEEINNDAPMQVELLGVRLVAFRDKAGEAHVLSDVCIHRGGSLGKGKIKDDCVKCPYHGWEFDGTGVCVNIPQIDTKPPARAKVDSYPVFEQYGTVFAFLGDLPEGERPPKPVVNEADQEGWRVTGPIVFELDAYYERSVENGMDPIHNEFVHPAQGAPAIDEERLTITSQDWGCRFVAGFDPELTDKEGHVQLVDRDQGPGDELIAGSWHVGPNQLITEIHIPGNNSFIQYFFEAPISKEKTRIFFINARNNTLGADKDEWINKTFMQVATEDRNVIEQLLPKNTPDTMTKELLLPGDAAVVKYREYLKSWEEKGWRIDLPTLQQSTVDVAYAIPSPARRDSKSWIIDEIPRMNGK